MNPSFRRARLHAEDRQDEINNNRQTIWPSSVDRPHALAYSASTRERRAPGSSSNGRTRRYAPSAAPLRPSTSIPDHTANRLPKARQHPVPLGQAQKDEHERSMRSASLSSSRRTPLSGQKEFESQEVRTSFRSALTTSSSFFSPSSGTERSSLLTDRSSVSDFARSQHARIGVEDQEFSVDDAIGMYEAGFSDDVPPTKPECQPMLAASGEMSIRPLGKAGEGQISDSPLRPRTAPPQELPLAGSVRTKSAPTNLKPPPRPRSAEPRDRYGFRKHSQYISAVEYDAWNAFYSEYLARRRKKWVALLKDAGLSSEHPTGFPARSAKLKRFVRKGIPPEWRGAAWFWYAGGHEKRNRYPDLYMQLLEQAENGHMSETDRELIERDLHRTFPDNIRFRPDVTVDDGVGSTHQASFSNAHEETVLLQSLRRVLQAFSIHTPRIGYCQSLNFIAGLLLLFMDEEKTFWMLCIITHAYLPGTHEVSLEGANVDLSVLMTSIQESMPAVWAKIGGELDGSTFSADRGQRGTTRLPPITLCTTAWFMSCYIGTLPIETVLRVWDSFFYEGSKTLFRIALAIFKVGESEIRAVSDPMEIFQVVQTIPRKLLDASALMEACFKRRNGFGHLPQDTIDARRKHWRGVYAKERTRASASATGAGASANGLEKSGRAQTTDDALDRGIEREGFLRRTRLRRAESKARVKRFILRE